MDDFKLFKTLCETPGPSGKEYLVHPVIKEMFKPFGEATTDNFGNLTIHKKGKGKKKIMLMAHADEIFLMITAFEKNGFLKFKPVGIDPKTLVSQEVLIHGKEVIPGIIGIKPPHLMSKEEVQEGIKTEQLLIDTGYTENKLREIVNIGDFVTIKREMVQLLNNNVAGKTTDDRAGIYAMYYCARELQNVEHDLNVYFTASCQEEVGHRGAKVASYCINPDFAIAIDVTFDNGPLGDNERESKIGGGPAICVGPNVHPKFRKKVMELAKEYNIPYNVEVEPGNTGTDAWDIQIVRNGIPTMLISIPIKYMHTSVEVINMDDIKNTGRLIAKFIEKVSDTELEALTCF